MTTSKTARFACLCVLFMGCVAVVERWAHAATAPVAAPAAAPAAAARQIPLEQYHLLVLSPSEAVAVLRSPDHQVVTLRVGNALVPARARLVQVLGDRLRSDLTDDERAEIKARGWRGPIRINPETGEKETKELSHEPIPLRDGGTNVVPRWPAEHAEIDPHRHLKNPKK